MMFRSASGPRILLTQLKLEQLDLHTGVNMFNHLHILSPYTVHRILRHTSDIVAYIPGRPFSITIQPVLEKQKCASNRYRVLQI